MAKRPGKVNGLIFKYIDKTESAARVGDLKEFLRISSPADGVPIAKITDRSTNDADNSNKKRNANVWPPLL